MMELTRSVIESQFFVMTMILLVWEPNCKNCLDLVFDASPL